MVMLKERIGGLVRHLSGLSERAAQKISGIEYVILKEQIQDLTLLEEKE